MQKTKIAIFASGSGSNAKAIIEYSSTSNYIVNLIITNKSEAGVLDYSDKYDIDAMLIDKESFYETEAIVAFLQKRGIDLIILAGFLWRIPEYLISSFENKIINIHPSLLPKYGGKGMYGINVHKAVFDAKEKESGITIHLVNNEYDKGKILFQKSIDISKETSPENIAKKVLKIEHQSYPQTIENFIENNQK